MSDGESYDFQRRDALHYHCYTLEPLLALCINAKLNGYDLFNYVSPKGCSLQKSVDFLIPYATGEKVHGEYEHSKEKFDKERGEAGQKDYQNGRLFRPEETLQTLTEYYFFNPDILPFPELKPDIDNLLKTAGTLKDTPSMSVTDKKKFYMGAKRNDYISVDWERSGNRRKG